VPDWSKAFWIESPWLLTTARRMEAEGAGQVAFDEDEGPARWLPWPATENVAASRAFHRKLNGEPAE
jgi:hypothetical protein